MQPTSRHQHALSAIVVVLLSCHSPVVAQCEFKVTASDAAPYERFGGVVVLDGNRAVGGGVIYDDGGNTGEAYVYRLEESVWIEEAKLTASDEEP